MSGAIANDGSDSSASMVVLALANAATGEATEGFLEDIMILGGIVCAGSVTGGGFLGTATSNEDGLGAGDDTLPLAAAVLVFFLPFVSFLDAAALLLLLIGRTITVNLISNSKVWWLSLTVGVSQLLCC